MKVQVKDVNSCEKLLTVDVSSEVVQEEFSNYYESMAKRAKIPGFRPGHAPKHVVALHFKQEAKGEVLNHLLSKTLREAVQKEEIPVIGMPKIEDVEFDETKLKYKARLDIRPKIKIDKYIGLSAKREKLEVSENEISDVLKRMQESHAKFDAVESREVKLGDYIICDYKLISNGQEIEKRDGTWLEIREKDYLEGFSKQLIGASIGETREVKVTFPADYGRKELAGKEGIFSVVVKELKEKKVPALDDEFAKESGEHATLEELKKAIHGDIEVHKKAESERKVEDELLNELLKKSKFDVPLGMVERRLTGLIDESVQSLLYRGVKEEDARKEVETMKKDLKVEAEKQVRISFLLDEIATREKIQVAPEDVENRYQALSDRLHRSLEEVKAYYTENEDRHESLLIQIINEKVIQLIKDKAVIQG